VTIGHLVQRVARTEAAQRILRRRRAARVGQALIQATTIRRPVRFVYRELAGSHALERYRLRRSGRPVFIRHNTEDPFVLSEIFYTGHYEVPDHVGSLLERLGRPPIVMDLGANIGLFGVWALERFPGSRVTAFEPDSTNAEVARLCIDASGMGDRWRLVEAAATAHDGRVSFVSGEFSRSRIERDGGAEVDAVDVFPYLEQADLAKIDIEGGEWAILDDPRFQELDLPALVLEYHPDQAPGPDSRQLAFDAMHAAGFETSVAIEFGPGHGMLWAWRAGRDEGLGQRASTLEDGHSA
jgi:FkbM family methyltransferase